MVLKIEKNVRFVVKMSFMSRVLMIDNFDSFTFILVDYFKQLNCQVDIVRNNVSVSNINLYKYDLVVISPGPSVPNQSGNLMQFIEATYKTIPIFGVCLGLQALVEFFGGKLIKKNPQHGKKDSIWVDQKTIFEGLPPKIEVGRYHSLCAKKIPDCFEISAKSSDNTIMAIRHNSLQIEAVQFHPESILSKKLDVGFRIIKNVLECKMIKK